MEGIILGQYVPGSSFLHNLDPRTKLILSALLVWVVFLLKTVTEYVCFGSIIIFLYLLAGVSGSFWRILRPALYLVLFTVIMNMIFTPGHVAFKLGPISFTSEGIELGLTMGFRLVFLIALSSLVTLTTSPVRMTDGLEILMTPLKKVGMPASELAMMMNVALRFIPTFWEEIDKIRKAQIARGADFESWRPAKRIKFVTALMVPLFVGAFRKADELSTAMEARGYIVGAPRTSLSKLKYELRDYLVMLTTVSFSVAFIIYKYY